MKQQRSQKDILKALAAAARQQAQLLEEMAGGNGEMSRFLRGGKNDTLSQLRIADGAQNAVIQTLHAMVSAGWLQNADGSRVTFQQAAEQILAPMGVTLGYIRSYLSKAYDQKNWHAFTEELERQAELYYTKRLQR